MLFIYTIFVVYPLLLIFRIAAYFSPKIKKGLQGRKHHLEELLAAVNRLPRDKKLIWFHSSSLGEFEQAKPIIEKLRSRIDVTIAVTFFSPSGYENSKKYPYAEIVTYLPIDLPSKAKQFISTLSPDLIVIMRYDLWPNHIAAAARMNIPILLVDGTMKKKSPRKLFGIKQFHKQLYSYLTKIFSISAEDAAGFLEYGISPSSVTPAGDTRFDRVFEKSRSAKDVILLKPEFLEGKHTFIAGSTWEEDEEILVPVMKTMLKYDPSFLAIIVPHEPTLVHLEKLENEFAGIEKTIRFSHMMQYSGQRVIIIDSIGILLPLYSIADAAFIGGSFKTNIHNVLEAAVYNIPVLYGPKIHNSQEAPELAKTGGGIIVHNKRECYSTIRRLFLDSGRREAIGKAAGEYVRRNLGASELIVKEITALLVSKSRK